jgi:poly(hydroxyalkanoate) granule-associated protein
MATKRRKAASRRIDPKTVASSMQDVWLAGLGALVVAQREGSKRFASLVNQGRDMEKRLRKVAASPVSKTTRSMMANAQEMTKQAQAQMKDVQRALASQVGRAWSGLGSVNAPDFRGLVKRAEDTMASVQSLAKMPAGLVWGKKKPAAKKRAAPAKRKTAKRTTAKRTTAKRKAAKH